MTAPVLEAPAPAERAPAFYWQGMPVYCCAFCRYQRIKGLRAVREHEARVHPPAAKTVRESPIVGPRGETVLIVEDPEA